MTAAPPLPPVCPPRRESDLNVPLRLARLPPPLIHATQPSMAANALVIFAKWPLPGRVKTRLCIEGDVVYVDIAG